MSEIDRITELLLAEEFGSDVPESLMGRELPNTEPTQHPLLELLTNQQGQDDFLMMMAGLPKQPAKGAINVGMQRFMLDPDWVARTGLTRAGAPRVTAEAVKRQDTINQAYQTALNQIRKAEDLMRDTIGMKNPTGQIKQADAMKAAALKEIERIRKAGGGKLPDLMPDKLTTEQIQQAMQEAGLGGLIKKLGNGGSIDSRTLLPTGDLVEVLGVDALEFPEELIEYLPPDAEIAMKVGDKYYSRPEDYYYLVAEAELEQYSQSQGRNDPDVKFGNKPEFDEKANISGTGIEEEGRNLEFYPDGSFAQEPNIYRTQKPATGKLLLNKNYLIGEQSPATAYYDPNTDTIVTPGAGKYTGNRGYDIAPMIPGGLTSTQAKTTSTGQLESHELMHRPFPNTSDQSVISQGNEHLYIADKTNDPELFESYRLEHYPNMPKPLFDLYYKNVIKRSYDNKFE